MCYSWEGEVACGGWWDGVGGGRESKQQIERGYMVISSSSRSFWTTSAKMPVEMLALAQVARSIIYACMAAGSVKGEVRVAMALCRKPIGMGGHLLVRIWRLTNHPMCPRPR